MSRGGGRPRMVLLLTVSLRCVWALTGPHNLPSHTNITSNNLHSTTGDPHHAVTHVQVEYLDQVYHAAALQRNKTSVYSNRKLPRTSLPTSPDRVGGEGMATRRTFLSPIVGLEEKSLAAMLTTFVNRELPNCFLEVVADGGYIGSPAVDDLVRLPNSKKVAHLRTLEDLQNVAWEAPAGCRGFVFLLQDPSPLLAFAATSTPLWDYQGRYLVVGASQAQLEELTRTMKGRKTEHIAGVVKSVKAGEWLVYRNQLYWGTGLAHVTTWKGDTFTSPASSFPDKTSDLRGALLKVTTFEWEPSTLYYRTRNGSMLFLYGRDVEVVRALARVFNFTIQFIEPPNGEYIKCAQALSDERWGMLLANGSWDGIVGLLGRGEADVAIANLFINSLLGRDQFQGYSTFFDTDDSCMMIRTEPPLPRWQAPGLPYTLESWLALLVGLLLSGPVLYLFARADVASRMKETSLASAYVNTLSIHFQGNLPRMPRRHSLRLLVGFLLLYTFIVRVGYSSNLTAFLTVTRQPAGIETLQKLYESSLAFFEASTFLRDSFLQSSNPYLRGLAARHVLVKDMREIIREIGKGRGVFTQNRSAMEFLINTVLGPSRKASGVRMMKECYATYNVALGMPRNSPIKSSFDKVISLIFESGLVRHWKRESYAVYKKNKEETKGADSGDSDTVKIVSGDLGVATGSVALSLDHTQTIFYVLLFCYLLSTLLFLVEMILARKQ